MASGLVPKAPGLVIRIDRFTHGGAVLFGDFALDVEGGQWLCVLGESGVGKTTLLRLVAGLAAIPGLSVMTDLGAPIAGLAAYMAQQDLLFPWMDLRANVLLGAKLRGEQPDHGRADGLIAALGLAPAAGQKPHALSGGMRQRAALARTMMEDRPIVLMDEPFSAVDAVTRLKLQDLARRWLTGRTVLMVTHDPVEAARLADRVIVLAGAPARIIADHRLDGAAPRALGSVGVAAISQTLLADLRHAAAGETAP